MPDPRDLTTTATMESVLGIAPGDANLPRLITAASVMVASYVGYPLHRRTGVVEYVASNGGPHLFLQAGALVEIESIEIDDAAVDPASYRIEDPSGTLVGVGGYQFPFTGLSTRGVAPEPYRAVADGRILVTLTAGYVTPGQFALDDSEPVTLPLDIEQAAISVATSLYRSKGTDSNIASYSLGNSSVSYGSDRKPLGDTVRAILAPYRKTTRRVF